MTVSVSPAADARPAVESLDAAYREATGHEALGEAVWIDLDAPGPGSAGFFAYDDDRPVGYVHVARADNEAAGDVDQWAVGLVVEPNAIGTGVTGALLAAARDHVAANGGGVLVLWRLGPSDGEDTDVRDAGFAVARELYQMRVPLPIAEEPEWPAGVAVRTFHPGEDDDAWLGVNNRAFASHAEQGGWTRTTLQRRIAEPWFDATLFFVAIDAGGTLIGFNWCKVHEPTATDPALGEIFVIGVDPDATVKGVGRALALTGLDAMAQRGIATGMLYCAADNERALRLYRSLGFDVHRVDRAYECTVPR
jgi:mycothiol synthase